MGDGGVLRGIDRGSDACTGGRLTTVARRCGVMGGGGGGGGVSGIGASMS